jgi:hypothetical protein
LLRLLAQAWRLNALVMSGNGKPVQDLAADAGLSPSYFTRVLRLSFLAPDITTAILQGRHPAELSAITLMRTGRLDRHWPDQCRQLGWIDRFGRLGVDQFATGTRFLGSTVRMRAPSLAPTVPPKVP